MGEPLTHPDLPLFLKMAGERGYKSVLTTNGTLLDKYGDAILESGIHKVSLSVHSFEDGTEESFLKYMKTLSDFAKKANDNGVIVVFRLWNKGFDGGRNELIVEYLKNIDYRRFNVLFYDYINRPKNPPMVAVIQKKIMI